MARTGPRLVLLCAYLLGITLTARSAPGDEQEKRLRNQLAVQAAFQEGQDELQRGNFEQAVAVLEQQIAHIDGNRRYLMALRDAYRGYIRQLESAGRAKDLTLYRDRLAILEPVGQKEKATPEAPAPAPPTKPGGIKSRAKVEPDDPFAESNSAQNHRARDHVGKADAEFTAGHYESAARLYGLADSLQPGSAAASQERWAYCKLVVVARALDGAAGVPDVAALEREVRQAAGMSKKVNDFAEKLLARLRGGTPGEVAIAVRHSPRQGNGWAVAQTDNCRIFHTTTPEQAERICRVAEATRVAMTRKWFGEEPTRWSPPCDIYIHPTAQDYVRADPKAHASSPGHSTISLEVGRVVTRRVDLRSDDPNMMTGVLPHETTHVVLAGRFGRHHVPRWADEGMAVLSEPRQRIDLHLRNLPAHRRDGTLFRLAELVRMDNYPEPRRVGPFYAQSVSLVEFLLKKKDGPTFARFLREGLDGSYEPALQRHYGYRTFDELERDWQQYAFGEGGVATASGQQTP